MDEGVEYAASGVGWQELLAALVSARGRALKRYGLLLSGNDQAAEDLLQEALLRVFAQPFRRLQQAELEAYVRRAMLNRFIDEQRRWVRWRGRMPRVAAALVSGDVAEDGMARVDVLAALRLLSPRQRACVVLRYYDDLPVAGIAERLGCSDGTVKRHLHDAEAILATKLEPYISGSES